MDEATIKSMTAELAKGLKTPEDLNQMTAIFKCISLAMNCFTIQFDDRLKDHLYVLVQT